MSAAQTSPSVSEEDRLRADLYNYLGLILSAPPDELLLAQTAGLSGDDTELGQAISRLAECAKSTTPKQAEREFNALFIGLARGELLPYASFYLTGFLNEKPLAVLRSDLSARRIERAPNVYEPEDNIATLMEVMGGLIVGRFSTPATLDDQKLFFNRHIAPWASHFYSDLETAKSAMLYSAVGSVGKAFMQIEREAFRLTSA
ncbi:molecular chaperone TorD family protein [Marivita sp. XM-24bin2]|jgi:TorA maturation chaperone TorD|uniref:TorD/DmsD family molecular chaperone n=1 Tax=unclassified Marivita TaxID=2632480 RepID=UPI000D79D64C|nr:molecular chaperone TorD family protein [Marivita sp. XM-24bin2]MCR9110665.1 molecular chaperone TorD family protein [Paracoccaceae bacterium]PWL34017.1 MAG: molecular chaperone TorD [Marivita sp. XM-24bin2]